MSRTHRFLHRPLRHLTWFVCSALASGACARGIDTGVIGGDGAAGNFAGAGDVAGNPAIAGASSASGASGNPMPDAGSAGQAQGGVAANAGATGNAGQAGRVNAGGDSTGGAGGNSGGAGKAGVGGSVGTGGTVGAGGAGGNAGASTNAGAGGAVGSHVCNVTVDLNVYTLSKAGCGNYTTCKGQIHWRNDEAQDLTQIVLSFTEPAGTSCTDDNSSSKWTMTDNGATSHRCVFTATGMPWSVASMATFGFGYDTNQTDASAPTNITISDPSCN